MLKPEICADFFAFVALKLCFLGITIIQFDFLLPECVEI